MQLTADQQDILDLLSHHNRETLLFEFQKPETATMGEFWVDIYSYGQFVEQVGGLGTIRTYNGITSDSNLIVSIEQSNDGEMRWAMTVATAGARSSHDWVYFQMSQTGRGNARGQIQDPIAIQNGVEIILHVTIFSHGSMSVFSDKQIYLEQPELIADYPYVFFVKAKFS